MSAWDGIPMDSEVMSISLNESAIIYLRDLISGFQMQFNKGVGAHLAQDHVGANSLGFQLAWMAEDVSITVVSELFNADPGDVRKLLKREDVLK